MFAINRSLATQNLPPGPFSLPVIRNAHIMASDAGLVDLVKLEKQFDEVSRLSLNSGTPLRPKAARVEPHTHTKRHDGNFLWSWPAEWLAGACAVRPYVAFHDILT